MNIKRFKDISEAMATDCQTPDVVYNTSITPSKITCEINLPMDLDLTEEEATELETNIHNSMEIVFSKYFYKKETDDIS